MNTKPCLSLCTLYLILSTFFFPLRHESYGQGPWTQKAAYGGSVLQSKWAATGFSIGNKGYIGLGAAGPGAGSDTQDFWEYVPGPGLMGGTWTQKASFVGVARKLAVGFSIGTKGYIGTGNSASTTYLQDFWEYDPGNNTWTPKANFGGAGRNGAVGFSIGTKGYIGTGNDGTGTNKTDFWEWDQATDVWTKKTDFGGTGRWGAVGFSIGNKGYIGTGKNDNNNTYYKDFWEWDGDIVSPTYNTWIKKTDFGGLVRFLAVGFSIGTKGYIGTGPNSPPKQDFWEWDQSIDTWTQKTDFGGAARYAATGFSIGAKGYIGTGAISLTGFKRDFWEYDPNGVTSISKYDIETSISVFPNPFLTHTTFTLSKEVKNASLKLFAFSGKEVRHINFSGNGITMERENLASGIYFYQIRFDNKIRSTGKLIVSD